MEQSGFDLLIVDDDEEILRLLTACFSENSLTFQTAASVSDARAQLARHGFKVVLSDHNLPDGYGVDLLAETRGGGATSVAILMTGLADLNVAIDAINRGKVYRFVTKPLDLDALNQTVLRALDQWTSDRERERLTREVLRSNERLRREAEVRQRELHAAADKIRADEETVERQKNRIEALYTEIQQAYLHTVTSLTAAIEAKDRYTKGHSERVFYYCSLMADVLGVPDSSRQDLRFASILHDLGKIGIPDSILLKRDRLSTDERQVMASHTYLTEDILKPLPFLENVRKIIREHHERLDGQGYPAGLTGDSLSLEGRILAVADAYDAMRSDRAYRPALSRSSAVEQLKAGSGTQFCPLCVGALVYSVDSKGEYPAPLRSESPELAWEEEFRQLRPASDSVRVDAALN
jgi:HD-GYP domain-containing protein (c-di-GMP phosphodiesterase class II)